MASALTLLGVGSVLSNLLALGLSMHDIGLVDAALGAGSGIAATAAGVLLWRGEGNARYAYLAWCVILGLYWLTMPEVFVLYAIPAFAVAVLLLTWGYRYVCRNTDAGPLSGERGSAV
jgi:hypothetical protein